MPDRVQSSGGSQLDNIVRTALDKVRGGTISGDVTFKKENPVLRIIDLGASGKDWRIVASAGELLFQENTGSEEVPAWGTRFTISTSGGA